MLEMLKTRGKHMVKTVLALLPWLLSMYLLYRLDTDGIWNAQTPYRDVITIVVLVASMTLSFILLSLVSKTRS